MDTKDLRGLMEAYSEVHAPQEVEEAVKGASRHDTQMRKASAAERRGGEKRLSPSKGKGYADQQKQQISYMDKLTKKNKNIIVGMTHEELDIFDVVLEFLQAEGYAETLEEAEWMMANVIDEEAIDIILDEGHGSRRSFKTQSSDERKRVNMFKGSKIEYTPHKNYDPEANRGQGQILRPNQAEKQRRKGLAKAAMGEEYMDEAQAARENPEKANDEYKKKYGHVRGERTPMPPRGDKRREDFEKWYAANVR